MGTLLSKFFSSPSKTFSEKIGFEIICLRPNQSLKPNELSVSPEIFQKLTGFNPNLRPSGVSVRVKSLFRSDDAWTGVKSALLIFGALQAGIVTAKMATLAGKGKLGRSWRNYVRETDSDILRSIEQEVMKMTKIICPEPEPEPVDRDEILEMQTDEDTEGEDEHGIFYLLTVLHPF